MVATATTKAVHEAEQSKMTSMKATKLYFFRPFLIRYFSGGKCYFSFSDGIYIFKENIERILLYCFFVTCTEWKLIFFRFLFKVSLKDLQQFLWFYESV